MSQLNYIYDCSLDAANTLGFSVTAERYIEVDRLSDLRQLLSEVDRQQWPLLALGGGSNLILSRHISGVVLHLVNRGVNLVEQNEDQVVIEVQAGHNWHRLIEECLDHGWYGLENMALIPGCVGAAPIQNIGAYGVELKDRFFSLQAVDRQTGELVKFDRDACQFAYRNSRFKGELSGRYIIWSVRFALSTQAEANLSYKAVSDRLAQHGVYRPTPKDVFNTVCAIRREKLPDPDVLGNAGSFFENPIVEENEYQRLLTQFPTLVSFASQPGFRKLAAGWLIDQAGWKGHRQGDVGVYEHQALVLVNFGAGNRTALLSLAAEIQQSVLDMFGVELQIEPRCYPI